MSISTVSSVSSTSSTNPFAPYVLAADFVEVAGLLRHFFDAVPDDAWDRPTEQQPGGWTLRETLAHLSATAETFQMVLETVLAGKKPDLFGVGFRSDLPDFNARLIAERVHIPPPTLVDSLIEELVRSARCAIGLSQEQLALPIMLPVYGQPLNVALTLASQLIHPSMVHAGQIAAGAGLPPIWRGYRPALFRRQIQRVFALMPAIYWPERGGDLQATIDFRIAGRGGGHWYVTVAPEGASSGEGAPPTHADLTLWTVSPAAFCRVITRQTSPLAALLRAEFIPFGDVNLGKRMNTLFDPT